MSEALLTHEQLQLALAEARSGADGQPQTNEQLIEHIIALYGAEFTKANDKIAELLTDNDNLFSIKQKTVIANNELKRKLAQIAFVFASRKLTLKALNDILAGVEEDLLWRYDNDARFHEFVQRTCAEMRARADDDTRRLDWIEANGINGLKQADARIAHTRIRDVIDAALRERDDPTLPRNAWD